MLMKQKHYLKESPMAKYAKKDIDNLVLDHFGLPVTFPPELVPPKAQQFINDTKKGMPAADLLQLATIRGLSPLWRPLPHMIEADVFGFGLDVAGMQVPLMAKMTRMITAPPKTPDEAPRYDDRQLSLLD